MSDIELSVRTERWPIQGVFAISRGRRTEVEVVVAVLRDGERAGWGEGHPYERYGETPSRVAADIEGCRARVLQGMTVAELQAILPPGAARNALDCALWDLRAKRKGRPVWELAGLAAPPRPALSAFTISLDHPRGMAERAREHRRRVLLKVKLGGEGDLERVRAVREAAPEARLIVDANEAWDEKLYRRFAPEMAKIGVEMIEQPLPAGEEETLRRLEKPVPLCADESCRDRSSLPSLKDVYAFVNIKLDKTGGLTEAIMLARRARDEGFGIMIGSMVGTSLAMAPAMLLGEYAEFVDLDGPLLLARDRDGGLKFKESRVFPPDAAFWG